MSIAWLCLLKQTLYTRVHAKCPAAPAFLSRDLKLAALRHVSYQVTCRLSRQLQLRLRSSAFATVTFHICEASLGISNSTCVSTIRLDDRDST